MTKEQILRASRNVDTLPKYYELAQGWSVREVWGRKLQDKADLQDPCQSQCWFRNPPKSLTFSCSGASGFNEDVVFLVALLKGRPAGGGDENVFRALGLTAYRVH